MGGADVAIYHAPPRVLATLVAQDLLSSDVNDAEIPRVAITTWETSPFPKEHALPLGAFDAVVVPSDFCALEIGTALREHLAYATAPQIHVIPHCFDETFWPALETPMRTPARACRFYTVGAWGERKNPIGVLRAYLHAFSKRDNVELSMFIDKVDLDELRSVIARAGIPPAELPALSVPEPRPYTEDELVGIHADGDCFVSATRGEGWGLGLFEAAVMGRYVIAPDWGGQADFLGAYRWYRRVPYQLAPCFGGASKGRIVEMGGQTMQMATVSLPPGVDCKQIWADPDLCALANQMRRVYQENQLRELVDIRTERAALEARFGYKTVGPLFANILRGIAWSPLATHSGL
jgi:glycosyltransferase involved in cell wall biosynthesis